MPLLVSAALLVVGCALLYYGAEWLVRGAAGIATNLRVPSIVIGLTVVAYGTSMPELVVGVSAGLTGRGTIAFGNVVGSNVANLGLILGLSTLISPPKVSGALRRRDLPVLLGSAMLVVLVLVDGTIDRIEGALLMLGAVVYTVWTVRGSRVDPGEDRPTEEKLSGGHLVGLAVLGLAFLLVGGEAFVEGASALARRLGMSERLVGLTIVAVGTSLPELATSLIAARRGHADIAIGNVVGSNIFNALLVLGASAVTAPLQVSFRSSARELAFLCGTTLLGAIFLRRERTMARWEGGVLLVSYAAFLVVVAT